MLVENSAEIHPNLGLNTVRRKVPIYGPLVFSAQTRISAYTKPRTLILAPIPF